VSLWRGLAHRKLKPFDNETDSKFCRARRRNALKRCAPSVWALSLTKKHVALLASVAVAMHNGPAAFLVKAHRAYSLGNYQLLC
jgi:hypothetical protein